jgi:hypothetical protein
MNVTDQWMLERMQQMAANMAASLPQTGQNAEPPKTEKGDTFKDMMDKAKDQKVEAPKKDSAPDKKDPVQGKEPVQKTEQPQTAKDATSKVNLDSNTAALVAAGYAQILEVYEDGSALILLDAEKTGGGFAIVSSGLLDEGPELGPVTITNAFGEQVTVTPEQIQEVFDKLGLEGPQKSGQMTLIGQLDLSKHQDMMVRTLDGRFTTLKEAMEESDSNDQETDLNGEALAGGEPLFKDVKAAPVKVGENFQLDTQQEDMDEVLADTVRYAAQAGLKEVEIMLNPQNLGSLTIKLTQSSDGILQVVFQTTTEKAANLLNQHLDNLNGLLQGVNQNEVRVEVQRGEDSQQAQQQQTNPDGHNHQQQQQQQQQEEEHSGDFLQKLRLGLFGLDDVI